MTEEQILLIAQQYKADVLDGLSNKRRKQGASAYLPQGMQQDIADGKLALSNDEIVSKVLEINQERKEELYKSIQFNDFGAVRAVAKHISTKQNASDINFDLLCEFLLKAQLEISSVIIDRMQGNLNNSHDNLTMRFAASPAIKTMAKSLKLTELWCNAPTSALDLDVDFPKNLQVVS